MKLNYEYTKKQFKNYLLRSRTLNNIILLLIGMTIYLYFTYKTVSLLYLPLAVLGLAIIIYLINIIYIAAYLKVTYTLNYNTYGKYILELTPNKFSVTVNKNKVDYKYNNIKKIKDKKNCFIIKFKNSREYLTFEKSVFNETDYNKMIEMFKEKINK